jgi:serine/threonine-protein kinase
MTDRHEPRALDDGPLPVIPDVALRCEIARGGMGVVYRGRQAFLERDVAVKLLAPHLQGEQFAARFRREARLLAGIKHPHIVACHTAGITAGGQSYLVMEFVDGPNLKAWIAEHGALAVPAALRLARQLASALGHAAELGVIHRDVKPENVLLETPTSTAALAAFPFVPKLVDLGLARMTHEVGDLGLTSPGAVMGTLGTMAPEQIDAPDAVDFRADIYGLGCVLYHMLTGAPAFASTKLTDVVAEKRRPEGPDPCAKSPAIPAAVGRLVAAMLSPEPAGRPASYRELIAQLDEQLDGRIAAAARSPAPAPAAPARGHAPLLQTAELRFLAADVGAADLGAGAPQSDAAAAFPTPSQEHRKEHRAETPRAVAAAPAPRRRRRTLIAGAVASALLLAAVPALLKHGDAPSTPPAAEAPAAAPAPAAVDARPRTVAIRGLDGTVRPRVPIELRAETTPPGPADGSGRSYRWSAQPEAAATFASPTAPSTTLRLNGLPGDAFLVALDVTADGADGGAPLHDEQRLLLDYPPADLFADFLDKSTDWLARSRFHGEWSRREDGAIVCLAPDVPCFRTRNVAGTVWRLEGLLAPERNNRRGFAETAVCLRTGPARQLAVVCERDGANGENWTCSLQEVEREEARNTFAFHPLAQPKTVQVADREGTLKSASYTITRRGSEFDIRFGFPGLREIAEHREHVRANADNMVLTLFARGGRGVFPKLELW